MAETLYDVLDVSPNASEAEITDAYRERIKETHPDVSDEDDAQEQAKRVIEAKEVLTDADERARYDRLGHDDYVQETSTDASWSTNGTQRSTDASQRTDESSSSQGSDEDVDWSSAGSNGGVDWSSSGSTSGASESSSESSSGSTWAGRGDWRDADEANARRRRHRKRARREQTTASSTTDGGTSGDGGGTTSNVGGPVGWATSSRHAVRNERERGSGHRIRLFPPGQSLVLLLSAFICYPALVFSSVFPPFPLVVNVIVGACTLFLIAYLTSMPEVGVYIFGGWTVLATFAVIATPVTFLSPIGILLLGTTWFPLGLTILTYWVLSW